MIFPESELILQNDGSIYHLALKPDDLAPIVITVGDPERVKDVSKHFDHLDLKKSYREFVTHTGYIGKKRITVISTGIGTDNIDIVLNELDALVNIDLVKRITKPNHTSLKIIRIGTSGALQPDIEVDSLLKSEYAFGLDSLLHFYETTYPEDVQKLLDSFCKHMAHSGIEPYIGCSSTELFNQMGKGFLEGITLTSPGFYAPQGRQLRYTLKHNDLLGLAARWSNGHWRATNFEMETSAIYGLSNLLGHQAISLNAIIANRAKKVFSKDPKKLIDTLIHQALLEISEL